MRIGILGSGLMGGKLGTLFARAGHEVVFSYARSEQKLKRLAREAKGKAQAGSPTEAAREADALLLAVHWSRVDDVLEQAGDVSGKVILTCSIPMNADDTALVIAHTSSGAEQLATKVRRAHVVSAFGTVPSEVLFGVFAAKRKANRPSLVYCGDDPRAKKLAAGLIRDVGLRSGWTPGRSGLRGIWSRSPCSSANSRTRVTAVRSSRTASSGSGKRPRSAYDRCAATGGCGHNPPT